MKPLLPLQVPDGGDEVARLIDALLATEQRIEALTSGEIDSVVDGSGRIFMLRRAQEQLRESEAGRQEAILDSLDAHIALIDAQGRIVSVNRAWRRFAGENRLQGPVDALGCNYLEVCDAAAGDHAEGAAEAAAGLRSVLDGGCASFGLEYPCHSAGEQRWFQMSVTPLAGASPSGAVVAHSNVTQRRLAAVALHASMAEFRTLAESMPQIVWMTRPDGGNFYFNPRWQEYTGLTAGEGAGHGWNAPLHDEDRQMASDAWALAVRTRGVYSVEARMRRADGEYRWWLLRGSPLLDAEGNVAKWFGTCTDIHDLKVAQIEVAHANTALLESERRFSDMLGNVKLVSAMIDRQGRITYCNGYMLELTGWCQEDLLGRNWFDVLVPPEIAARLKAAFRAALVADQPHSWREQHEIVTRYGERRLISFYHTVLRTSAGKVSGVSGIGEDVTEQRLAEMRIKRLNRVHAVLSGINTLIVRVRDREELFAEACRIATRAGGLRMSMIVLADATGIARAASDGIGPAMLADIDEILAAPETASKTMVARAIRERKVLVSNDPGGDPQVVFASATAGAGVRALAVLPLLVGEEARGVLALYSDEPGFFDAEELALLAELAGNIAFAIDHIEKQELLDYLAYYDALTGCANRSLFLERAAQALRAAADGGHRMAVFLVDLERFKNVNDSLGRPAGDVLLKQVAQWLSRNAGDASLVARIGADHFAVLLPRVKEGGNLPALVETSLRRFHEQPFRLDEAVFRLAAKVGAAVYPEDGPDAETLFMNAEAALKKAKVTGEPYLFHTQKMTEAAAGKLTLENQLRNAVDRGEFVLHYQPKMSLSSRAVSGAEALIRWNDPRTGLVPPGQFIPVLEETGLIYEVGRWALRRAIEDYLGWKARGLPVTRIAVNVSPLQLRNRGFIKEIEQLLSIDALAACGLELELTESLIMEDVRLSIASLQAIRAMGVTVAIDDFGTGFSSLAYLARLPVDTLKIDRSFVVDMTAGARGLALVSTIIDLAHSLKLSVVAEGVETEEQSRLLALLGCDEMQGFLFSRPVAADAYETRFLLPSGPPPGEALKRAA